jgi:hypothetical protein
MCSGILKSPARTPVKIIALARLSAKSAQNAVISPPEKRDDPEDRFELASVSGLFIFKIPPEIVKDKKDLLPFLYCPFFY